MQQYYQSPISNDPPPIEISQNNHTARPSRAIDQYEIEYGFVPIKGEPNLYHKEYYYKSKNSKPTYDLPDYGPPYSDTVTIQNQIYRGTFEKSKPKNQYKPTYKPTVPAYYAPTTASPTHYAQIENSNTSKICELSIFGSESETRGLKWVQIRDHALTLKIKVK